MYRLTIEYRTKSEAREAVKRGENVQLLTPDGRVLDKANGESFPITGKLAHYQEWKGSASVWNGKIRSIK